MELARILIADEDPAVREACTAVLIRAGHRVEAVAGADEALRRIAGAAYDLLLLDLDLDRVPAGGIGVLEQVKRIKPSQLVVVIAARPPVAGVLGAFRNGAFDFLEKPVATERMLELASRALAVRELGGRRRRLAEALESERLRVLQLEQQLVQNDPFKRIVGHSPRVLRLLDTIREVARTESTVLLTGESGTGKSLVARTIHEASTRRFGPFVEANCVVYSEGVLHSELFGHERGAFTGAARMKKGRFELACGGTLFLDEIGDISPATQLMLLRVLQERTFERVGGEETLEAEVRLIAATNRDLEQAMQQAAFRSDLFYRLNVIPVRLPALRDHPEDVPLLAEQFLAAAASRLDREIEGFTPEAMEALAQYPWPGNVRELENVIERVVVLNHSGIVRRRDLPEALRGGGPVRSARGTLQSVEREKILEVLRQCEGNKKQAALRLGIHRSTLYAKMRRHGVGDPAGQGKARCRKSGQAASRSATVAAGGRKRTGS